MAKHTLLCSLLALLLVSFNHAANAQAGGTITLLNPDKKKCALYIPGPGSGVTQQFNLSAQGSVAECKDWKVRSIVLTDLPSAATIYMTDDPWCTRGQGKHEITLRTAIAPTTSTDPQTPWEIIDLYAVAPKNMIAPGLQLREKRMEQGANPRDSVKCIEVTTSKTIDTPKPVTTTLHDTDELTVWEWNSKFDCPQNKVIVSRLHMGDWEGGVTHYRCASLRQGNNEVALSDESESTTFKESGGHYFSCPPNQVMKGRSYTGTSDGSTHYRCATPKVNGRALTVTPGPWSTSQVDKGNVFTCEPGGVMVGRWHEGYYSGPSRVRCATVQ
ncbi:hypothetical protein OSW16_07650 [Pseudomonas putida]|uniref:hypothetical protein n=1 Tax=Pseudomonas putida TaxID=303 RepID=UPI0022712E4F|nr:hypothetical protein [Pseudomonas putida]WAB99508.1 hypothetical protein OSW16_07650 [Pseudomonas putida]